MSVRDANLLLSDAAAPPDGIQNENVLEWYGGPLSVFVQGAFDGASIEVCVCARIPKLADGENYGDVLGDGDWVPLGAALTQSGVVSEPQINPCLLGVRVTTPGANTRVRAIIT